MPEVLVSPLTLSRKSRKSAMFEVSLSLVSSLYSQSQSIDMSNDTT